jgi:hypothetical protein
LLTRASGIAADCSTALTPKYPFGHPKYREYFSVKHQQHAKKYLGIQLHLLSLFFYLAALAASTIGGKRGFVHFSRIGRPGIISDQEMWEHSPLPDLIRIGRRLPNGDVHPEFALWDKAGEGIPCIPLIRLSFKNLFCSAV